MREIVRCNIHTRCVNHDEYVAENYNVENHSSGFLVYRNKETDKYFPNWIDNLQCPRIDVDISLRDPETREDNFKDMDKELKILCDFFKSVKVEKLTNICKLHNFFDLILFKFENNGKDTRGIRDFDTDILTNYFLVFDVNCSFREMYGMEDFRQRLIEKGIHEYCDYDDQQTAIILTELSVDEIDEACNKIITMMKFYSQLIDDMNVARKNYFLHFITQPWENKWKNNLIKPIRISKIDFLFDKLFGKKELK